MKHKIQDLKVLESAYQQRAREAAQAAFPRIVQMRESITALRQQTQNPSPYFVQALADADAALARLARFL